MYLLGERVDAAPAVVPFSVGAAITKVVHIASYFAPWTTPYMDFHTESRGFSYSETSFWTLLKQLWQSDWGTSRDIAPFDCTYASSDIREKSGEGVVHAKTYYRSYAARWVNLHRIRGYAVSLKIVSKAEMKDGKFQPPSEDFWKEPAMYYYASPVASFDFSAVRPIPTFVADLGENLGIDKEGSKAYRENDGVVPFFSQWHPYPCK